MKNNIKYEDSKLKQNFRLKKTLNQIILKNKYKKLNLTL